MGNKIGDIGGVNIPDFSNSYYTSCKSGWTSGYKADEKFFTIKTEAMDSIETVSFDVKPQTVNNSNTKLKKGLSVFATDPIKLAFKDVNVLLSDLLADPSKHSIANTNFNGAIGIITGFVSGLASEWVSNKIQGKETDWKATHYKYFGKAISGLFNIIVGGVTYGIASSKKGTGFKFAMKGLDKQALGAIFDEKALGKEIWESFIKSNEDYYKDFVNSGIKPYDTLKIKDIFKLLGKDGPSFSQFMKARQDLYSELLGNMFKGGFKDIMKNLAGQMAATAAFDYVISLGSNLATGLIKGQSFMDAIKGDNMHYGSELLKSVNKTIFAFAGRFIGYTLGCPKAGEALGSTIGTFVNTFICDPFTDEKGVIDEGACAIAAGCEIVGAIAIATVYLLLASNPVGWVIGLCLIAGALVGWGICAIVYNWDHIIQSIGDFISSLSVAAKTIAYILLSLTPIGKVIADFLLVGSIVSNWDDITKAVGEFISSIGAKAKTCVGLTVSFAKDLWKGAVELGAECAATIVEFVGDAWDVVTDAWDSTVEWTTQTAEKVGEVLSGTWEVVTDTWDSVVEWSTETAADLKEGISDAWDSVVSWGEGLGDYVSDFWDSTVDTGEGVIDNIVSLWDSIGISGWFA